jgi:hypothetical protein
MDWTPLAARAAQLPLVLAGPVVRRVESTAATVWVALRAADTVTLSVLQGGNVVATNSPGQPTVQLGDNLYVAAVTATTPAGAPFQPQVLYSYQLEFASIAGSSGPANFGAALGAGGLAAIVYSGGASGSEATLPSFVLPPQVLSQVNIAHTGCRKAHGEAVDALPLLDGLLAAARSGATDAAFALARPQQLILTGDQTYNDDVTEAMLALCIDAGGWLMGTCKEPPPTDVGMLAPGWENGDYVPLDWFAGGRPAQYSVPWTEVSPEPWPGVGQRALHTYAAGFTVANPDDLLAAELRALKGKPFDLSGQLPDLDHAGQLVIDWKRVGRYSAGRNQLMTLAEFLAMNLLAYSPALWQAPAASLPLPLPLINDQTADQFVAATPLQSGKQDKGAIAYRTQQGKSMTWLRAYYAGLAAVRRALANVATYAVFDDHDVCDDWYMNREWCERVFSLGGDTLGRRMIRNALIAFAVVHAWGNTPAQYAAGGPGADLLTRLAAGEQFGADLKYPKTSTSVSDLVGIPQDPLPDAQDGGVNLIATSALERSAAALSWSYTWAPAGWPYEVIALDSRTTRGYEPNGLAFPILLDDGQAGVRPNQYQLQIPAPDHPAGSGVVSLLIVQTPLLGCRPIEDSVIVQHHNESSPSITFDRDNEFWSLNKRGFEALLARAIAHNPMTILLSGDVHYSMAAVADYWATYPWNEDSALDSPRTGRLVQLTSSAARNEDNLTRWVHQLGIWINAQPALVNYGSHRTDILGWFVADPRVREAPFICAADAFSGYLAGATPDWKYRVAAVAGLASAGPAAQIPPVGPNPKGTAAATSQVFSQITHGRDGSTVVGLNNIALVSFAGTGPADWSVTQTVYWRPADPSGASTAPSGKTAFTVPLQYQVV